MKRRLFVLTILCLLLAGCARETPAETPPPQTEAAPIAVTPPAGLYDPDSALERQYNGALRVYPLSIPGASGLMAMGEDLLVFSDTEENTLVTRLTGEELRIAASVRLGFPLSGEEASLRVTRSGLSFFDPVNRQTVVLDASLKEISHISAPEGLLGTPILSDDRNTLYYCDGSGLRAWDLETGIHRLIKEMTFPSQSVTGLHCGGTVVQCRAEDGEGNAETLLLSAENGRLLYECGEELTLVTRLDGYYAAFPTGCIQTMLFGGEKPRALTPAELNGEGFYLEARNAVVTASVTEDSRAQLDCYDLETGLRAAALTLPAGTPEAVTETADGCTFVLLTGVSGGQDAICRWEVESTEFDAHDTTVYTGPYYTAAEPDYHGLVRCQSYADTIGQTNGVRVRVWEDALAVQPWDYDFEMEYLVPVLRQELKALEQRLANFPAGMLEATASHFSALNICLVRSITGSAESGSLDAATGVMFLEGTEAYIVLAAGETSEKALYHELYHVMETHILGNSIALDQWDKLNPVDFTYDYDYAANARRDGSAYLQSDTRSFVDTYSMSFPKEDRARILEYAMTPGNGELFLASPLQFKLKTLCQGIREAYGLKKSPENYRWEQYLVQPMAYTGD